MTRLLVCLCGPTASGKTALAEGLAAKFSLQLLSVDSMQLYRGMDIGTAKPPKKVDWAMLDMADPGQSLSAGTFARLASGPMEKAWAEGKTVLAVGGSGLYFRALCGGLADIPVVEPSLRKQLEREWMQGGLQGLVEELRQADPEIIKGMDLKNPRRVLRALEVWRGTGRPLSDWQSQEAGPRDVRLLWMGLDPGPEALNPAIQARIKSMMTQGWLEEARSLEKSWGRENVLSTGALGYREVYDYLDGRLSGQKTLELIFAKTRQYARRQRTWFRKVPTIHWLPWPEPLEAACQELGKAAGSLKH
jgi:tRNA dimethylallyltransferase